MKELKTFQTQWGGKTLTIQTGKYANQANGSCTVQYGDTVVLAAATMSES
ncbi:MAG: Polyribonucleotide nucleotidyltransferase, partial [Candidatus Uhrbacteria bacterium GW2011_GWA2_53_10]